MRLRRCAQLFLQLEQEPRFDINLLLSGGSGLDGSPRWLAYAPHLPAPVALSLAAAAVLAAIPLAPGQALADITTRHDATLVAELRQANLLLGDDSAPDLLARDAAASELAWWPPALLAQTAGAWDGVDIEAHHAAGQMPTSARLVDEHGPAPAHDFQCRPGQAAVALASPQRTALDSLLAQRRTCRNFDSERALSASELSTMLYRVWGATGSRQLAPGAVALRKSSPAGGGLHVVECYLLVQRAEGLAPGLYHYLATEHALEPLLPLAPAEAVAMAQSFVGGQHWFRDAPVLAIMTARFDRLFWKYRGHAKAWRVAHLDTGHLSQTMYLAAADLGLGAFVTAAINDVDIARALDLPPLREAALAVVGFGPCAATRVNGELDELVPTAASRRATQD
ncbi:putative peptide maturation dehydrogenase [Arenimonas alkanexedens]